MTNDNYNDTNGNDDEAAFVRFLQRLHNLLAAHGLNPTHGPGDPTPDVPEERVAVVLMSEVHEWFREGRIDASVYEESFMPDDPTWTEFCRAIAQAQLEADRLDPAYPTGQQEGDQ